MQASPMDKEFVDIMYTAFILVTTIILLYTTIAAARSRKQQEQMEPRLITVLRCPKCGYQTKRQFRDGDYVGLETNETCPKCGSKLIVYEIYAETSSELPSKTLLQRQKKSIKKKNPHILLSPHGPTRP
jgi:DNA-directed RNA polymerase subunit M/transcription elongation factor TFIIS